MMMMMPNECKYGITITSTKYVCIIYFEAFVKVDGRGASEKQN